MSQWSEKIPKENLSKTVSPTRYLFTSFSETWIQINNFRKSSKKFIIDLLTKNIALNLSGAIFFVGLGYSLKWWYKDQLFVVLLKQNLPALRESQQNIYWETGKSILNDEYQTWTPLIDRIDLDANHIRIKFKEPWQKHFYEQFIGVFGEPAQVNINKQILTIPFTGEKNWWKKNSSVSNNFTAYPLPLRGIRSKPITNSLTQLRSLPQLRSFGVPSEYTKGYTKQKGIRDKELPDELKKNTVITKQNFANKKNNFFSYNETSLLQIEDLQKLEKSCDSKKNRVNKFSTYALYTQKKPIFPKKLFKLSPHNLCFLNQNSLGVLYPLPLRGIRSKPITPSEAKGYAKLKGIRGKEFLLNTKQRSLFNKAWALPANERLELHTSWEGNPLPDPSFATPSEAKGVRGIQSKRVLGVRSSLGAPRAITRVNWGSWRSKAAKQKDFNKSLTSTDKFSYPLHLTKKLAGWQPFPNLLVLNLYLDEIPYKLENALQSYFPRKNSQLLFWSTSFRKYINSRNKSLIWGQSQAVNNFCNSRRNSLPLIPLQGKGYGTPQEFTLAKETPKERSCVNELQRNNSCANIRNSEGIVLTNDFFSQKNTFNNVVIKSNSVNTLLCKASPFNPSVLHAFTQKVFTHYLPFQDLLHKSDKYTICNSWQSKEGLLSHALLWSQEQKSQKLTEADLGEILPQHEKLVIEELEAEDVGVKAYRGLLGFAPKSKNNWVSNASTNYKSTETENNETEKTLDLFKEMFLVPGKQNEQSETYLKKLHLFEAKKLLQNQLTSLINSFPIDLVEKSKASVEKDKQSYPTPALLPLKGKEVNALQIFDLHDNVVNIENNKSNLFEMNGGLLDVAKKILEVKRNALKKAMDPGVKGQYLPGLLYKSLMCNSWQSKERATNNLTNLATPANLLRTANGLPITQYPFVYSEGTPKELCKRGKHWVKGYAKQSFAKDMRNWRFAKFVPKEPVTEEYWNTEVYRLTQLFAYSTVANAEYAKKLNPLLLLNTLGFTFNNINLLTNPPILSASENKINVVDKDINFDKNSRYMSGYIYPDIESNSLKAFLYPWLGKNKNLMLSHYHYLNDKPIALYSKNLESNYNHHDSLLQQHKANLLLSHLPIAKQKGVRSWDNLAEERSCVNDPRKGVGEILLQHENEKYAKHEYYPYGIVIPEFFLIGNKEKNSPLENSHYMDNMEIPYKKFNHYRAKFPGFSDPTQFFTTLPQIACGNENLANESSILDELNLVLQGRSTKKIEIDLFEPEKKIEHVSYGRPFVYSEGTPKELVSEKTSTSNIVDKSEINKKFIQKNGCNSRKVAYSGIVVQRNKKTKDFQPFKDLRFVKKCKELNFGTNQRFGCFTPSEYALAGTNKSSIWGTFFLGPENPLTNRQCHFFGQKQLSTLDTKSLQRDYLRELGKEILTQSNSKGYTELLPLRGTSIERTKILSLSKKVNSFFFKKRKYSYLLEPKDQWHLLFQEQLCSALEDCKKYPLSTIHSFEETNMAKLDSGRIKVSAPLVMAHFPKKLVQFRSIHDTQYEAKGYVSSQLEQGISWRPFCHLQRSFIYTPLKDNSLTQSLRNSFGIPTIARETIIPFANNNSFFNDSSNDSFLGASRVIARFRPLPLAKQRGTQIFDLYEPLANQRFVNACASVVPPQNYPSYARPFAYSEGVKQWVSAVARENQIFASYTPSFNKFKQNLDYYHLSYSTASPLFNINIPVATHSKTWPNSYKSSIWVRSQTQLLQIMLHNQIEDLYHLGALLVNTTPSEFLRSMPNTTLYPASVRGKKFNPFGVRTNQKFVNANARVIPCEANPLPMAKLKGIRGKEFHFFGVPSKSATRELVQQQYPLANARVSPHYPLFTERFSEEINALPYLNKNSLFYSATDSSAVTNGTKFTNSISLREIPFVLPRIRSKVVTQKNMKNNLVGVQNMCTSLLIQEPLNCNSWAVLNQWVFLIALLFWIEQTLLNHVFPALFALEQILLSAAGLRTGENNRTHVLRISKNETPKFQNLAGIDGLLGELSELVLFLRGQRNLGLAKLSFWNKWNKKNSYGVLLTGSPGTGKTFLVRALANEANVPVLILSASTLTTSKLNNNKPSWSIRHAFKRAKQLAPCILFIDEIDALGKSRGKIVTDINEIVADTNLTSTSHKKILTKSTHNNSASLQQMFSYEQFGQNSSNFNATLLNKWEYPLQSTILQESNEINQNSLCQEKLVDLLKIAGRHFALAGAAPKELRGNSGGVVEGTNSFAVPSGKESATEFKESTTIDNKGVLPTLEKEMTRGKFGPLTQLLVSMDGVSSFSGVLIMGATNRPELLDPALTRPGRFEKTIRIDKPSEQNRIEILQLYSQNLGVQQQIPWSYLATRTIGLTTADLAVAMNYSSLKAIIQDSVHTLETIEYGLNCITRL